MVKSARYQAPLSGQIIGTVVSAMGIQPDYSARSKKTASRYFKGRRVTDSSKHEVFEAIGKAIIDLGIIPSSPFMEREGMPLSRAISGCVAFWADEWDKLVGQMRTASAPVDRPDLAAMSYLRLATIDLALRVSAIMWLAELPTPKEGNPLWANSNGGAEYLKQLLDKCGDSRPTREQLADLVGVSDNTVDSWLDASKRPSILNIDSIAEKLALRIDGLDVESLKADMRRHYTLCSLGDLLARQVGRDYAAELGAALVRLTSRNLAGLREFSKLPPFEAAMHQVLILTLGVRFTASEHLLRALWRQEKDPVWAADLDSAFGSWHERLSHVARYIGGLDEVVQRAHDKFGVPKEFAESVLDKALRQAQTDQTRLHVSDPSELEGMTFIRVKGDAEYSANNRMVQAVQAQHEGDYETAIVHLRRAVELQPDSASHHFHLGANLGLAGEVEEGILECQIATLLDDDWELPKVEVGIILLNANRPQEAREHLENVALNDNDPSSHLAVNLGVARQRTGDLDGALNMLEHAISKQPDNGLALDNAAYCAFLTGNANKGRDFAKRARQMGHTQTYREWRAGNYRAKNMRKANSQA